MKKIMPWCQVLFFVFCSVFLLRIGAVEPACQDLIDRATAIGDAIEKSGLDSDAYKKVDALQQVFKKHLLDAPVEISKAARELTCRLLKAPFMKTDVDSVLKRRDVYEYQWRCINAMISAYWGPKNTQMTESDDEGLQFLDSIAHWILECRKIMKEYKDEKEVEPIPPRSYKGYGGRGLANMVLPADIPNEEERRIYTVAYEAYWHVLSKRQVHSKLPELIKWTESDLVVIMATSNHPQISSVDNMLQVLKKSGATDERIQELLAPYYVGPQGAENNQKAAPAAP